MIAVSTKPSSPRPADWPPGMVPPTVAEIIGEALSVIGLDAAGDTPGIRDGHFNLFAMAVLPFLMSPLNLTVGEASKVIGYAESIRPSQCCYWMTYTPAGIAVQVEMLKRLLRRVREEAACLEV